MIDIIQNNPFRLLGVCANATKKDIVANEGKMKAFLKVGKAVSFPLDLPGMLPPLERTAERVAEAMANLALPKEKMRYAQFWFVRGNHLDDTALNQLAAGDPGKAIGIWQKKDCTASFQNRMVLYLIGNDLPSALDMVHALYEPATDGPNPHSTELLAMVMGEDQSVDGAGLARQAMEEITKAYGADKVLAAMPDGALKRQTESLSPSKLSRT